MNEPTKGDRWTCGTHSGYVTHRHAGEDACDACRAAAAAYQRAWQASNPSYPRYAKARRAARTRLVAAHRDEYQRYYAEELARLRGRSRDASQ